MFVQVMKLVVSVERASPRGYAFLCHPAWGGGSTFVSAAALSQDECIIAKTAADGAAVFDETPSLKAPRLQTVRNLLSILFRLFCIIGHGALKPQHTIAR